MENLLLLEGSEPWSRRMTAGLSSLVIHACAVALILFLGTNQAVQKTVKQVVLFLPDRAMLDLPKPIVHDNDGGGGGGDRSALPAPLGGLPRIAARQFVAPKVVLNNLAPKLIMEPTIVLPPDAVIPNMNLPQLGNPFGKPGPPSNGTGSGDGIGEGEGGGDGNGKGPGVGSGNRRGGFTGPVYRIGDAGLIAPVALYRPEPEYSEEARKAKWQGSVLIHLDIDEHGLPCNVRVVQPLGLGLDEKAVEAVSRWRFKPGMKGGRPVVVGANIEVSFRLL
jgi:TonB family protein